MSNTVQKKIVVVNTEKMMKNGLFMRMMTAKTEKLESVKARIQAVCAERTALEAQKERVIDGVKTVGQSPDIKHVEALASSDAFARLALALDLNVERYINPKDKTSSETSSLKAYKKALEIADTIYTGQSKLENVVKVFTVCAFKSTVEFNREVLPRDYAENFFSSSEYRSINQGSEDFMRAMEELDAYRAHHMTGGKQTQTSQMIRTLVALGSASDVREGRSKNVAINPDGQVIKALMHRFGVNVNIQEAA